MQSDEKVITTAIYRRCQIVLTSYNRYIVTVIGGQSYPADTLDDAKKLIDDFCKAKNN
jgi:hypothetical protein